MKKQTVINVVWMVVSFIALFFADELKQQLTYKAWVVVMAIASAQLLFGIFIKPVARSYIAYCEEKRNIETARKLLGVFDK